MYAAVYFPGQQQGEMNLNWKIIDFIMISENIFCPSIVNMWNSLSDYVVDTDNLAKFKTCIEKFWQHQEVLFNYKSKLSGSGNRSHI